MSQTPKFPTNLKITKNIISKNNIISINNIISKHNIISKNTKNIIPKNKIPFPDLLITALIISPQKPKSLSFQKTSKKPLMSQKYTKRPIFSSPSSLSEWLQTRLPSESFATWGIKPGTKNVHNLWLELNEGETILEDKNPPIRTLNVVIVKIKNEKNLNKMLIEAYQELSDGSIRKRFRPLSEKMKPGENLEHAVIRGVKEELGSVLKEKFDDKECRFIEILKDTYEKKVEERVSVSYPGLLAIYNLHSVEVKVEGLPDGEFWTEEEEYGEKEGNSVGRLAVSCKKHFWKWVDSDSV